MKKLAGRLKLRPGCREEYIKRHDEIWPEMKTMMAEAGIHNYTIWLDGEDLFEYMEVDDPEAMIAVLKNSEVKKRWDLYMSDILIPCESNFTKAFEFN